MGGKAFIDTNVLLRANNTSLPLHQEAYLLIQQTLRDGFEVWVSRQVIREYLAQITRPGFLSTPISAAQAEEHVQNIQILFQVADETEAVTRQLIELLKDFPTAGKQIHDANIVATMLVYDIDTLLTQNLDDMKRFASKVKLIPLVEKA